MANFNINKVIIGGRLTSDIELKQTESGVSVVRGSIAVNRRFKDPSGQVTTDFFNFTAWRKTAELIARCFHKGSSICIIGEINNRVWTDKQGVKRYMAEITADDIYFVDAKADGSSEGGEAPGEFVDVENDGDLPF